MPSTRTRNLLTTRCTPLPYSSGIVSLGCPIGHHETFMPGEVMDRLRPVISSTLVLAHVAKRHPAEAQRLTAISLATSTSAAPALPSIPSTDTTTPWTHLLSSYRTPKLLATPPRELWPRWTTS